MKLSKSLLGLISCLILGGCAQIPQKSESSPPSVILVLADDLGWADISCQGSAWATPAIDQLAAEGVRLTRAYSNGPNCAPSRACLMTGLDVAEHGVFTVAPAARGKKENRKLVPPKTRRTLEDDEITIAEMLKGSGYRSAHIGKWHLGDDPRSQGFDVSIAGDRRGHPKTHLAPWKLPHLPEQEDGTELADALTDHAIDFIRECGDQPYLLVLSHYAVHTPVQVSEAALKRWQKIWPEGTRRQQKYAALVESVDRSVSRLMEEVRAGGEGRETVIIFTSDNGGLEGFTDNGPLRGGKGMLYEGGIRTPLIMRWPDGIEPGATSATPVIGVDLYPTLAELAGAPLPDTQPLDGVSLLPTLMGSGDVPERDLIWHFPAYLEADRSVADTWRTTPASALRRGPYKVIHFFEDDRWEVYDLTSDESETNDLAGARPELTEALRSGLQTWWTDVDAFVPTEPNPLYRGEAN